MPRKIVEMGDVPSYDQFKQLRKSDLPQLAILYNDLKKQEKDITAQKKDLAESMMALMVTLPDNVPTVEAGGGRITRAKGRTAPKILPTKLVDLGVDPDVIQQATEEGREYHYITVTFPKEDE